jgi:hypothetical protein
VELQPIARHPAKYSAELLPLQRQLELLTDDN